MATTFDTEGAATIIINTGAGPTIRPDSDHPKMIITAGQTAFNAGQVTFEVPYAPQEISMSSLAAGWTQIERPGRAPLVVPTGRQVPSVQFEFVIADPDGQSIAEPVANLRNIAGDPGTSALIFGMPILEQFGLLQAGWRITQLDVTVTQLQRGNVPTMATCRMTLVARNDADVKIGPAQSSFKPVTLNDPPIPLADALSPVTQAQKLVQDAIDAAKAFVKKVAPAPTGSKPIDAGRGNKKGATLTAGKAPKDDPVLVSWVADGFYGPNPGGTEPGASQNRKAWTALASKIGRATTEANKVALEAGKQSFDCPNLGDHVTVKDSAGNFLFVKVIA